MAFVKVPETLASEPIIVFLLPGVPEVRELWPKAVLFEPITDEFEDKIQEIITNSVQRYIPNVSIDEIDVDMSNENKDKNLINISLKFRSRSTGNSGLVSFNVAQIAP